MVAVPLCGRRRVIGVLEAFSAEPFGFNDSDVGSLELLAELILGAAQTRGRRPLRRIGASGGSGIGRARDSGSSHSAG